MFLHVATGFYEQTRLSLDLGCKLTQHRWKRKNLLPSAKFSSQENTCRDYFLDGTIHLDKLQAQKNINSGIVAQVILRFS